MTTTKSPMKKYTIKDFWKEFPDNDVCLEWLKNYRWPNGIFCKICGKITKHHRITTRRSYACQECGHHVHPTAGTIYNKSDTPLTIWFYTIYLMSQTRGGISAKQIQRETGVTYKTAWRMCKEVRSMLSEHHDPFGGEVELDESYFGGAEKNKHANKRTPRAQGRSTKSKTPVFGMVNRRGKLDARAINNVQAQTILPIVWTNVQKGAQIYTDEYKVYNALPVMGYKHGIVSHADRIYVTGHAHTNNIEGFWSQCKNGIRGVYHAVSAKIPATLS